jgi:hypothetical protein
MTMPSTPEDQDTSDPDAQPPPVTEPEANAETYSSRIVIKPGGEVLIENLSMDLMELALMLDPEAPVACNIEPPEDT